jgi:hypothetical protein
MHDVNFLFAWGFGVVTELKANKNKQSEAIAVEKSVVQFCFMVNLCHPNPVHLTGVWVHHCTITESQTHEQICIY